MSEIPVEEQALLSIVEGLDTLFRRLGHPPEEVKHFCVQVDGITFLSKRELDDYYAQQVDQEYQSRGDS